MLPRLSLLFCLGAVLAVGAEVKPLVEAALAAEARLDSARALELFLQADAARPNDAFILQKIARQYSDLTTEQPDLEAKKRYAQLALDHALRAAALEPGNPVNVLSLAVCHGKLAVYSDTRTKVRYSRLVKEEAERALALDPNYAWAHHILGRWHHEVASLGVTARWVVRLFYGGLPDASPAEAVRHLERAVALEPGELNHHLELGFAYAALGRATEARTAWRRGLAMPDRGRHDAPAKHRARQALADLGEHEHDRGEHQRAAG
jgi:tetratricopeptide (TPR) repeat protein